MSYYDFVCLKNWPELQRERESHVHLVAAWGNQAPLDQIVLYSFQECEREKLNVFGAHRSGRS